MIPLQEHCLAVTRRHFFRNCGVGLGKVALAGLLTDAFARRANATQAAPFPIKPPHFAPKAKRVIHLFMAGAPCQLELFDYKPELVKRSGQLPPAELLKDYRAAFIKPNSALLGPKYKFAQYGNSGMELGELIPHIGSIADDICLIRSMQTDAVNHAPAQIFFNTGFGQPGRPSMGSWVLYGLGSENQSLPGFVALSPGNVDAQNLRSAFLPGAFQGTAVNSTRNKPEELIENIRNQFVSLPEQRRQLDLLQQLNEVHAQKMRKDGQLEARLQAYELAFQMQLEAVDAFDLGDLFGLVGEVDDEVVVGEDELAAAGLHYLHTVSRILGHCRSCREKSSHTS